MNQKKTIEKYIELLEEDLNELPENNINRFLKETIQFLDKHESTTDIYDHLLEVVESRKSEMMEEMQ